MNVFGSVAESQLPQMSFDRRTRESSRPRNVVIWLGSQVSDQWPIMNA